ncbi:anion transporter [Lentibacillus halodurans]|uniref:Sodium-dependent dicarboxylate transporter SdcS n=1 Tax=Lentibacillus halodurans TaxID=237679 RepID=A0A1I0Z897_9BACI|nr:SLC13 family permease [Lentibacillus halodurans]SFB21632.1 anion transporter [Lentibacillus halodurans]
MDEWTQRHYLLNTKWLQICFVVIIFVTGLLSPAPVTGLDDQQWKTLLLLVISIFLWSSNLLPLGISSLFIIAVMMIFNLADSFSSAISGFIASALYFVLIVSMISKVMVKVGLDKIIAGFILRHSSGNMIKVLFGFIVAAMVLPILMPSAVARFRMFHPLIDSVNRFYDLQEQSSFRRFCNWLFSGGNQFLTMIVLTGGGYPILASELLDEAGYSMTWVSWFLYMMPPIYLATVVTVTFAFFYFGIREELRKISRSKKVLFELPDSMNSQYTEYAADNPKVRIVFMLIILMLMAWLLGSSTGIPTILPPILVLTILSLPGIRLFSDLDFRNFEWETFLLIGSAISLSNIVQRTGTADWLANVLFGWISPTYPSLMALFFLMIMVLLLRMFFTSPTGAIAVILPLAISFGHTLGLPVLSVALLTILVIGSLMILPIYSNTTIIAYQSGVLTMKDYAILGTVLLIAIMGSGMLSAYYLW